MRYEDFGLNKREFNAQIQLQQLLLHTAYANAKDSCGVAVIFFLMVAVVL